MAVNSYISDITEKDERIQKLGSLLATTFFGMFVGSFLSGVIQDVANLLVTYCTVMFLHVSFILLTTTCLRESLKSKEKTQMGISTLSLLFKPTNVKESIGVLTKKRQKGRRLIVLIMFLITLVNQVCKVGEQTPNIFDTVSVQARSENSLPASFSLTDLLTNDLTAEVIMPEKAPIITEANTIQLVVANVAHVKRIIRQHRPKIKMAASLIFKYIDK
jgi:MFS family permease